MGVEVVCPDKASTIQYDIYYTKGYHGHAGSQGGLGGGVPGEGDGPSAGREVQVRGPVVPQGREEEVQRDPGHGPGGHREDADQAAQGAGGGRAHRTQGVPRRAAEDGVLPDRVRDVRHTPDHGHERMGHRLPGARGRYPRREGEPQRRGGIGGSSADSGSNR